MRRDLELLTLPPANWPAPRTGPDGAAVLDVAVVGAGMNGIGAAGALQFKGVRNIMLLDRAEPGREGPWLTFARMETLRSPKTLTGPALGVPSLTFRAWYEARFGTAAWEQLYKIPNEVWVDYLAWLQRRLGLPVRHGVSVESIVPEGELLRLDVLTARGTEALRARRVVLATGRGGAGGAFWPDFVDRSLVPELAIHTNDLVDLGRLRGTSIAVLGGGASAWDFAASSLEAGADRVDMYVRRSMLPQVNKGRGSAFPGFLHGWATLPDAVRWELMAYLDDLQAPVPHETVKRALKQPAFHIHLGTPVRRAVRAGNKVAVTTDDGPEPRLHDFLCVGTGFDVDVRRIPELGAVADGVASWGDVYDPPEEQRRPNLQRFPYLGPGFELTPLPGAPVAINRIHLVNFGAHLSHAGIASDIPGVNIASERVATAIATSLFREDLPAMRARIEAYDEPELIGTPFFVPKEKRIAP